MCAECTMAGQVRLTGGGRLVAVACRSGTGELLMPCGRCRQVLYEFGGPSCLVDTPHGAAPLAEVLPDAFGGRGGDDVDPCAVQRPDLALAAASTRAWGRLRSPRPDCAPLGSTAHLWGRLRMVLVGCEVLRWRAKLHPGPASGPAPVDFAPGVDFAWRPSTSHPWGGLRMALVGCEVLRWCAKSRPGPASAPGPSTSHPWGRLRVAPVDFAPLGSTSHGAGGVRGAAVACEVAARARVRPRARRLRTLESDCARRQRGAQCRWPVRSPVECARGREGGRPG
jgi:hypothetical protein